MFDLNRRSVLFGSSSLFFMTALGGCEELVEQIKNRPIRKDVGTLANNDPILVAYRDAITQMQALPSTDPRNWTRQAETHLNTCPHGNWFFLPWHRAYLMAIDSIVRELSGYQEFSMPYWNWTCDRSIPAPFWQSGSVLNYSPRTATSSSQALESIVGPANMATILSEPDFELFGSGAATALRGGGGFQGLLESQPHNYIHGFTGGTMGTYMSPLDPIFWLHHCNIDRVWFDWNSNGNANTNDPIYTQFQLNGIFFDGTGQPMDFTVGTLGLAPLLTYQYEDPAGCLLSTSAMNDQALRELIEAGSSSRLRVLERGDPIATDFTIGGRQNISAAIPMSSTVTMKALEEGNENRVILRLEDVKTSTKDENFFVQVYVDLPDGVAPNPKLPNYAGAFAFFLDEKHDHGSLNYVLDLTETIERLEKEGRAPVGGDVQVSFQVVPVRSGDKSIESAVQRAQIQVGAIVPEIIARDISKAVVNEQ